MSIKNQDNVYKELFNPNISEAYKDKFIKIPCEFFKYLQQDDKLLLTLSSLLKRKTIYNTVTICLKDIILENYYTLAKGTNRSIEQFRNSLFNLIILELIEFCSPKLQNIVKEQIDFELNKKKNNIQYIPEYELLINSVTTSTIITFKFNEEKLKILTSNNFTMLDFNVLNIFRKICKENSSIKMANLVNIYILIKKHIEANNHFSNKEWNISISSLKDDLKLSEHTIINTIKILEDNQILFVNRKNKKNYYSLSKEKKTKGTWLQKQK
jgi:hypothetical protein